MILFIVGKFQLLLPFVLLDVLKPGASWDLFLFSHFYTIIEMVVLSAEKSKNIIFNIFL